MTFAEPERRTDDAFSGGALAFSLTASFAVSTASDSASETFLRRLGFSATRALDAVTSAHTTASVGVTGLPNSWLMRLEYWSVSDQ
jgi:hypothetical protein